MRKLIYSLFIFLVTPLVLNAQLWETAEYVGSFRVSADNQNKTGYASRFGYGGGTMDLGFDNSTMWIEGHAHDQLVAEVKIPELIKSTNPADLNIAPIVTPFLDMTKGAKSATGGTSQFGGIAFDSDRQKVWWTIEQFYDVSPDVWPTVGYTNADLSESFGPWMTDVGNKLTERYIELAPQEIADQNFGGKFLITGQAGVSGTAGSSQGFNATAVETPDVLGDVLSTQKILFYPMDKPLPIEGTKEGLWWRTEKSPSMEWITLGDDHWLAFTAIVGVGDVRWYGPGNEPPEGGIVDRWKPAKSYHAPPYEERLYIYELEELLRVTDGEIETWEARPSEVIDLRPHLFNPGYAWTTLAFDEELGRLYLSEDKGDSTQSRYERVPVIHAFDFAFDVVGPDPIEGDFNGDGVVDQEDLNIVLENWGDPVPGWLKKIAKDGIIDQKWLNKILENWGTTASVHSTPEPEAIVILLLMSPIIYCLISKKVN